MSMKIRANDIDLIDAERFDSFSSVIINYKKYIAALIKGSGYIYVTVTFFKSRVSSFFNIFRVAKKFINFIINA